MLTTGDLSRRSGKERASIKLSRNVTEYRFFTCIGTSFLQRPTGLALCLGRIKSEERKMKITLMKRKQHTTLEIAV